MNRRFLRWVFAFGFLIYLTGATALEAYLIITPRQPSVLSAVSLCAAIAATGFVGAVVSTGYAARLGFGVRPRKWLRRLFGVPDDYQPPPN